jgi:methionine aminopeptidase type I
MAVLPGGTVTFLFTDIEGSTRLLQELGDAYGDVVRDHRLLLRGSLGDKGGTEVDTQGDAFFYSFPRARDAVAGAVAAQRALSRALAAARAGARLNEIGRAVSYSARRDGFNVVRELSGHGIGRTIHEPPAVPNVYERTARQRLNRGLVLAIEPMLTSGSGDVVEDADGWTVRTADGALAAHAEHTIVVTEGAPLVLTAA